MSKKFKITVALSICLMFLLVACDCNKDEIVIRGNTFAGSTKVTIIPSFDTIYYPTERYTKIEFDTTYGDVYGFNIDSTFSGSNITFQGFHVDMSGVQVVRDTVYDTVYFFWYEDELYPVDDVINVKEDR